MVTASIPARAIRDQHSEVNCCTSCALAACLEGLRPDLAELSPLFHYHLSGGLAGDRGLTDTAALAGGFVHGFCLQTLHPHPISRIGLATVPTSDAVSDGKKHRLSNQHGQLLWSWIGTLDPEHSWRRALDSGQPLFLAIAPDTAYARLADAGVDTWEPTTAPPGQPGTHAVAVLGYDDGPRHFIVQDSRGPGFGAGGQWFLPYDTARSSNRITAAYRIGG